MQAGLAQAAIEQIQEQAAENERGLQREDEVAALTADEPEVLGNTTPAASDEAAEEAVAPELEATAPDAAVLHQPDEPSEETEVALLSPPEIEARLALSREQRQKVQRALAQMGYDPGPADGEFGDRTRAAVTQYQAALGEEETGYLSSGIVGLLEDITLTPPATGGAAKAQRYALVNFPPAGTDPRLTKALEVLSRFELIYGTYAGHLYLAVLSWGLDWEQSKQIAEGAGGHLVTIADSAENAFVYDLFAEDERFINFYDDGQRFGPWIGLYQPDGASEPKGGWRWVTEEALGYTNWSSGQPNNFAGTAHVAIFHSYGTADPGPEQRTIRWDDSDAQGGGVYGFLMEVE